MKNRSMIYIVLNFLLLQTSTSTYSIENKVTYTFDDIIQAGHKAEDNKDRERAEMLYMKAYQYKKIGGSTIPSQLVQAVINNDEQKERTLSQELQCSRDREKNTCWSCVTLFMQKIMNSSCS
ncbi:MAG: hypothetical protein Q8Q60_04740 [Candidatus Chromulinivorax sp.]|nr:hypothetical protein [Candidatus Chromulinivorax sp.]